jgi:hypothetical protein
MLLQNKQVQKELGLEEEDVAKIPDAVMAALAKSLSREQFARLTQIQLQQRGNRALTDAKVQKSLKITTEQKEQLDTIVKDADKARRELFGAGGFGRGRRGGGGGGDNPRGNFEEVRKKMADLDKETTKKIDEVLTADQKKKWKALLGKPFKLEQPRFGGGGRRGGRGGQRPNQPDQ